MGASQWMSVALEFLVPVAVAAGTYLNGQIKTLKIYRMCFF